MKFKDTANNDHLVDVENIFDCQSAFEGKASCGKELGERINLNKTLSISAHFLTCKSGCRAALQSRAQLSGLESSFQHAQNLLATLFLSILSLQFFCYQGWGEQDGGCGPDDNGHY